VAEWSKAPLSKSGRGASSSRVRIPPSPPTSMSKQGITIIVLIILILVLGGALAYVNSTDNISIPDEYVKVTKSDTNSATLIFEVLVDAADVNGNNVSHCIVSMSAGSERDGRGPECEPATKENGFTLDYDSKDRVLIITGDSAEWGLNNGPFRVGCAACESAVQFKNIRTTDGQLLPEKIISVY
jgi:hypothetical protein